MLFQFGLYSGLLLLFFVIGILITALLFFKSYKNNSKPERWLAWFILLCTLYITPWMLGFAGWYDAAFYRNIIFYVSFHHLFFVGPVMYFYVQSLLNPSFRVSKKNILHLIPGIVYVCYSIFMWLADCYILNKPFFYAAGNDREFDTWYQTTGLLSMIVYFIISLRYYNLYKKLIVQTISYADKVLFQWLNIFLWSFLSLLIIKALFLVGGFVLDPKGYNYADAWWQYFLFGVVFCYIGIMGYQNSVLAKQSFSVNVIDQTITISDEQTTYKVDDMVTKNSVDESLEPWKAKINVYMEEQKAYTNEELSLTQMAKDLGTNPNVISKTINQGFGLNFNDYVNKYRVNEVQKMLESGSFNHQTLLSIAFDCGFNSKATFNRAFKKYTNLTPKEWMDKNV